MFWSPVRLVHDRPTAPTAPTTPTTPTAPTPSHSRSRHRWHYRHPAIPRLVAGRITTGVDGAENENGAESGRSCVNFRPASSARSAGERNSAVSDHITTKNRSGSGRTHILYISISIYQHIIKINLIEFIFLSSPLNPDSLTRRWQLQLQSRPTITTHLAIVPDDRLLVPSQISIISEALYTTVVAHLLLPAVVDKVRNLFLLLFINPWPLLLTILLFVISFLFVSTVIDHQESHVIRSTKTSLMSVSCQNDKNHSYRATRVGTIIVGNNNGQKLCFQKPTFGSHKWILKEPHISCGCILEHLKWYN